MDTKIIKTKLNKIFEDMGGGMVSSAAGIVGIEGGMEKKKKTSVKKDLTTVIKNTVSRV